MRKIAAACAALKSGDNEQAWGPLFVTNGRSDLIRLLDDCKQAQQNNQWIPSTGSIAPVMRFFKIPRMSVHVRLVNLENNPVEVSLFTVSFKSDLRASTGISDLKTWITTAVNFQRSELNNNANYASTDMAHPGMLYSDFPAISKFLRIRRMHKFQLGPGENKSFTFRKRNMVVDADLLTTFGTNQSDSTYLYYKKYSYGVLAIAKGFVGALAGGAGYGVPHAHIGYEIETRWNYTWSASYNAPYVDYTSNFATGPFEIMNEDTATVVPEDGAGD